MKRSLILSTLFFLFSRFAAFTQPELMAWGNLTGIRVEGQLMEFETRLCVAGNRWENLISTAKEKQRPSYKREGGTQTVRTELAGFQFTESITNSRPGEASVVIETLALSDSALLGAYFCLNLPSGVFQDAVVMQDGSSKRQNLPLLASNDKAAKKQVKKITIESQKQHLTLEFERKTGFIIRKENASPDYQVYFLLLGPPLKSGQSTVNKFTINVTGLINRTPVEILVAAGDPGRKFAGFGGNFRLQNPKADPQVIQYCLTNMRVAWGRVELPWQLWQPYENTNPMEAAVTGKLDIHIEESMLMAKELASRGIPVILSDWTAPAWAMVVSQDASNNRNGNPLNQDKIEKIYKSLGDYIEFLKEHYGVEPAYFSFNESDIGINIRQTGEEHARFIKEFGAYLASRGLITKLLLGDNSDATSFDFILPAINDAETEKFIGAISFHSWRGCDDETLKKWADAARKLNVPLIIAEAGTDAAAWNYPDILFEDSFALDEINLYTRICSLCQPLSILQWQLTSDYSLLMGDGIYNTRGPLRPGRRFWNLKQLSATPVDAFSLPVSSNRPGINCAAFGNIARGEYAVHIVNNGAERQAEIKGLPEDITMEVLVTDAKQEMQKTGEIKAAGGVLKVDLPPAAMITLLSRKKE